MADGPCRLRVKYVKDGHLAYLGHLEVLNTVMRCVRRSGLPFEVGNGFARRMRIQFSQALPVGASSMGEYYDLMQPRRIDPQQALGLLRAATPEAIAPQACVVLPRKVPSLESWASMSRWDVLVRAEGVDAARLAEGVASLRRDGCIHFLRGTKPRTIALEPTLVDFAVRDTPEGVALSLTTRSGEEGALRPAVLVNAAVGCAPLRVCRLEQWHEGEDGARTDPMGMGEFC